jgi:beta-glucosidase
MRNRTYRYFKGTPLYPFGYGLSYTTFAYSRLHIPATARKGQPVPVTAYLTNTGKRAGEEVVQLYLSYQEQQLQVPQQALKGFLRIHLEAGETKAVRFLLRPEDLAVGGDNGEAIYPAGKLTISLGGGQPGLTLPTTSNTLQQTITLR